MNKDTLKFKYLALGTLWVPYILNLLVWRPGEQKTGKKTSQKSSRDSKSGLVFFSKSPPIGLVKNLLVFSCRPDYVTDWRHSIC
jgi:hypothetical protein